MYNKKEIIKTLNEYNYFIDESVLDSFIKNWKIDPMYEDDDGVEFFDNLAIIKLKKGIRLKSQGYDTDKIVYYLGKIMEEPEEKQEVQPIIMPKTDFLEISHDKSEKKANMTIDVSSQTLKMIAEAVAQKISGEIKKQFEDENFVQKLIPANYKAKEDELRKDNETLAKQVQDLLSDNKQMAKRIDSLEHTYNPLVSFVKWLNIKLGIK